MKGTHILCLLFISGFCSFTFSSSKFHFVNLFKNYTEAKSFCREMYTDLATVGNSTDMDSLIALVPSGILRAWIGLEIGDARMWHWTLPDQMLNFFNWKAGEPQENDQDACVAMTPDGEWFESDCDSKRSFVCDGSNNTTSHTFIAEIKSWREAQNHCRGMSTDLVSIQSAEDNRAVQNVSRSQSVWIGLFKDPWKWSDGSYSSFRFWKPNQPKYNTNHNCVAAIFKDSGQWNNLKCSFNRRFICHGARKSIPIPETTKKTSTQQAVTTAQMLTNLTVLPNSSLTSQDIKTTVQTTTVVAVTEQSSTANITTNQAITSNSLDQNGTSTFDPTTPNTTEPVSPLNSTTEILNKTTETATVTEIPHLPPTSTMQITTDNTSASSTLNVTTTYSSTGNSTTMSSVNIQGLTQDKLILIHENMSWNEAMSYCRERHVDLVSITDQEVEEWVARKAKNATSSHVWLGLRYTCSFNFWFWIRSDAGCYQNWAPGHGSEGQYGCGITGAIEATGGQQWVGLPETSKLNFICYTCPETSEEARSDLSVKTLP